MCIITLMTPIAFTAVCITTVTCIVQTCFIYCFSNVLHSNIFYITSLRGKKCLFNIVVASVRVFAEILNISIR